MRTAAPRAEPLPSAITISHVVYALHAAAIVLGALAVASVVPGFQIKIVETSAKADCSQGGC